MKQDTAKTKNACPRTEIIAYIDGELSPGEELDLEMHFAVCEICAAELNEQKKLLCALDSALEDRDEIELPDNFTKVVVANAESNVKGLRCPRERNRAIKVFAALFTVLIMILGAEASQTFASYSAISDQLMAVGGFFVHLIHDIAIAATVILRSFCLQFVFKSAISILLFGFCFAISFLIFSRLMMRFRRF